MSNLATANPIFEVPNIGGDFPQRRIIVVLAKVNDDGNVVEKFIINGKDNFVATRVSLTRNYGGIDPQASVSLCNLSEKTINAFMTPFYAPKTPNQISVYAGYETIGRKTSKIPLLFNGTVLWAIPTQTRPDTWFQLTCLENFFRINSQVVLYPKKRTPFEAINEVCKLVGITPNYEKFNDLKSIDKNGKRMSYYDIVLPNYEFKLNTFGNFLNTEIKKWGRMSAYMDGGILYVVPCSDDLSFILTTKKDNKVISAWSNPPMIGNPKPNPTGVDLTTLFPQNFGAKDNITRVGNSFKLDTAFFPAFNMNYWIQKITYSLQNRENDFYCNITARR